MPSLFTPEERVFVRAISALGPCNPFTEERIRLEREALGGEFEEGGAQWNLDSPNPGGNANYRRMLEREAVLVERLEREWPGGPIAEEEAGLYEDLMLFHLYHRVCPALDEVILGGIEGRGGNRRVKGWGEAARWLGRVMARPGLEAREPLDAAGVLAFFFQIRRAFVLIFYFLVGGSGAMSRLRAAIWESVFTHDLRRYRRTLRERMGDIPTLITGPSGTGKELVARAIALSRWVEADGVAGTFALDFSTLYLPLNLAALSPTLIESELFGHRKGAFTGAVADRAGWLEVCPVEGSVFLDEVGEVSGEIQVKLLRVLQVRTFQRLGDTETRRFPGKIVAATNRDLAAEVRRGSFREDFYYRLCADRVTTPTLAEQVRGAPAELERLVRHVAARQVGEVEAGRVADEALAVISRDLGPEYPWPGNFRELEQCVRNIVVRRRYEPLFRVEPGAGAGADLEQVFSSGAWTAERVLQEYCRRVHAATGSIEETARRLDVDRRTVRARLA